MKSSSATLSVLCRLSSTRAGRSQVKNLCRFQTTQNVKLRCFGTNIALHNKKLEEQPLKPHSYDFSGRHCLVTGGASGIGYEITKQLLLSGVSSITITSRSAEKAQTAISNIKSALNLPEATISFIECDFSKPLLPDLLSPRSNINTLINCAGITQSSSLLSTSQEATSQILRTNLEVPIELSRRFLINYFTLGKSLSKSPSTSSQPSTSTSSPTNPTPSFVTISISSLLSRHFTPGTSIYSTSKAGLTAFTRSLVLESASIRSRFPTVPPFRANVVEPGYIETPMIENFSETYKRGLEEKIPAGRFGKAEEVAGCVLFLVGNEYANGSVIGLDGGLGVVGGS